METRDFSFELPEELIAQFPPEIRGTSRLLLLDRATGRTSDHSMQDFPSLIPPGSLILFNDTKVRKSRLFAETENGGSVEFLLLSELRPGEWETVIGRRSGRNLEDGTGLPRASRRYCSRNLREGRLSVSIRPWTRSISSGTGPSRCRLIYAGKPSRATANGIRRSTHAPGVRLPPRQRVFTSPRSCWKRSVAWRRYVT